MCVLFLNQVDASPKLGSWVLDPHAAATERGTSALKCQLQESCCHCGRCRYL